MATLASTDLPASVSIADLHWACVRTGKLTILDLFDHLPWYRSTPGASSDWTAWRAFLCAVYGLPMSERELAIFQRCTGRKSPPRRKVRELWVPVGRRGRKTAIAATIAVWEGGFREHDSYLAPGEVARIPIISKDKDDAGQMHSYCEAILREPGLAHLLADVTAENVTLTNRIEIRTRPARLTAGRSRSIPCALLDELAFWPTDESAQPDVEIIRGILPGMANVSSPLLGGFSSPYAKRGVLWAKYKDCFGLESDDVLVWLADTLTMHDTPEIRAYVEMAWKADPASAVAEVGTNGSVAFRSDVEAFLDDDVIRASVAAGVTVRPPQLGITYQAFADPSGGSADSFTLAISHWEPTAQQTQLDMLREWPAPFDPDVVVAEASDVLRQYGLRSVQGDRYAGEWPVSRFRAGCHYGRCQRMTQPEAPCGCPDGKPWAVTYYQADMVKSDIYLAFLPIVTGRNVALLDNQKLINQLTGLDRRTARGGHDSVDHLPGAHDDLANAVAGAVVASDRQRRKRVDVRPEAKTVRELHTRTQHDWIKRVIKENQKRKGDPGGSNLGL